MTPAQVARAGRRCGESDASAGREPRAMSPLLLTQIRDAALRRLWSWAYDAGWMDVRDMQDRKSS